MPQSDSPEPENYSGQGWDFIHLKSAPEMVTAPITVVGVIFLIGLLCAGLFLILRLISRVWQGGADTVPAASAALTAIAAIFGALFLTWRTIIASQQARASIEQAAVARESHYTTLFTKAVEQLGATREVQTLEIDYTTQPTTNYSTIQTRRNFEVRLGAIYALERIAKDSQRDHWPIMEVLSAYIRSRENAGSAETREFAGAKDDITKEKWLRGSTQLSPDIKAALDVIARRPLHRIHQEQLSSSRIDLSGTSLQLFKLENGNLSRSNFRESILLGSEFNGTSLYEAEFQGAVAICSSFKNLDLRKAGFQTANIHSSKFHKLNADQAFFFHANMAYSIFQEASFRAATFLATNLSKSIFENVDFQDAYFNGADLSDTRFLNCNLSNVTFQEAKLFSTDLSQTQGMKKGQLDDAFGDATTKLPVEIDRPLFWPREALNSYSRDLWMMDVLPEMAKRKNNITPSS